MTKVKICGITNLDDALLAVELGADALGFNFYEKSPRFIPPLEAVQVIKKLTGSTIKVGVFVNKESSRIGELVALLGLAAVQLHGDEDVAFVKELRHETDAKVIKAFRVGQDFVADLIADFEVDAVLLDAYSPNYYGGTGDSFDWNTAREVREFTSELYLAGGLTSENVANAIRTVRPYAVDVASGVELRPGKKDPVKLQAFIRNAKSS
jgi:phosphoribosylanthranilate isomerase